MLFNSFQFLFFFVIVTSLYFALPYKNRWLLLLVASCYFYMAFVPIYILILGFTIVIDYFAGILIEDAKGRRKRWFLIMSLIANIGVLAVFKYYNFINENLTFLLHGFALDNPIPYLSILLPIGLSFHTFQAMSYTIEVYRGHQKAERHFGIYSLYVMFYPQLVAGPIERPQNLLHQFHSKFDFDYDRVVSGLKLMAWGLFKKVVIADRLAVAVDMVYNRPDQFNSLSLVIATIFFSFQIYCDFSGYSDMAIGAGRVMGFKMMMNFNNPYISKNITEFWRRWHISLSTWLRDYLYNPVSIGVRNWGIAGILFALFLTFFISGIWHGAGWKFAVFGIIHGVAACYEVMTKGVRKQISKSLNPRFYGTASIIITFCYAGLAWIYFRADDIATANYIVNKIGTGWPEVMDKLANHQPIFQYMGLNKKDLLWSVLGIFFITVVHNMHSKRGIVERLKERPAYVRWSLYYGIVLAIVFLGVFENRQFIYFQF